MKENIRRTRIDKRRKLMLACVVLLLIAAGCASSKNDLVRNVTQMPITPHEVAAPQSGALWPGENVKNMLFTDNKARRVNDIVTIVVNESSEGTNKAVTSTSRDSATTAGIAALLGLDRSIDLDNKTVNKEPRIGIGGSSSNSLKGTGDTSRGSKLTTRLAARVVKVLDNGNLVVEGRRQLTVNDEDQYIVISGIIRPEDITFDNLIASQYISDARIYYTGDGVINDKMRPGWLTRVVDWVWPF